MLHMHSKGSTHIWKSPERFFNIMGTWAWENQFYDTVKVQYQSQSDLDTLSRNVRDAKLVALDSE